MTLLLNALSNQQKKYLVNKYIYLVNVFVSDISLDWLLRSE